MNGLPELTADRARPSVRRPARGRLAITLGEERARRLQELARAHGTTPCAVLLTVYRLLIGRRTGTRDVTVVAGSPEGGLYLSGAAWDDGTAFAELLDRADGERHEAGDSVTSGTVLFVAGGGLGLPLDGRFDMACLWDEPALGPGGPRGLLAYDTDLFDRATAERFRGHYLALLDSALAAPGAPVRDLVHTTAEERELLAAWGRRPAETSARTVVDTFRAQAGKSPDAVALRFADGTLGYGALQERATRLAERLAGHGVTPESVVGLAMEPSAALVTAMLAVLITGAAYLPLDPGHPDARLAHMLTDSGACLVLADRDLAFAGHVPVLRTDTDPLAHRTPHGPGTARPAATSHPFPAVHPDQRACVLYTSGSTGRPKGVAITHRGIVRLVHDAEYLGLGPSDVVAQVANTSFDAATFEIWGALLNGARLVGVAKDDVLAPERLRERITEHGVTAMLLTTVLANRCAEHDPAMFAPLRTLFFGGEAADTRRVAALRRANPGLRLVNAYGPTEGTTIATVHPVSGIPGEGTRLPIGRPIADTRLHVLDPWGREAGVGVPGELHLGGAGLARGYVGRPDLTAERFVPSPFGSGDRLYRTGDIVRWRNDGELEYLGRADSQIKIRGVRIEPEEIAGALTDLASVRAAVVDVRGEGDDRRLVGYVTTHDGLPADPGALRSGLAARLPAAMIPSWYVTLPELPVTPNGKVDRRALPEPAAEHRARAAQHVAPRNAVEETVALVWAELLGLPAISVHDDFLALGGHSLLATRAVARIADRLGVELGVRDLFEAPTVARFAARAADAPRAAPHRPVRRAGSGPHRLSFAQQRLWFLDRLAPGSALYNVPLVLEITGRLDVPALRAALKRLLDRHETLRTRFTDGGSEPHQILDEAADRLDVTELGHLPEDVRAREADRFTHEEAQRPFDLTTGPLFRARLLRLTEDRARLLLTMHHAVCDGWSTGVLMADLAALYTAAVEGGRPAPSGPAVRYADYAEWQREHLAGVRERQLDYWRERLRGAPPALDLPVDRARPAVPRYRGDTFPVRLGPELTRRLEEVCRAHGVTRFMVLMAVFQLLLGRYTGTRDVSVGTPVSGRVRPQFEQLVGFLVNTLVIRTRWEEELTFADLLGRVREVTLGAYAHQDVPFEQVVEAVRPPRQAGRTPLFQAMLAMQNLPRTTTALPGLGVTVHESPVRVAKFDLTAVWDEGTLPSGSLDGYLEYDADLFERATAERLAGHYLHLLRAALAAPQTPLRGLPTISEQEATTLAGAADDTPAASGETAQAVHELIRAVAAARPDQPAISQAGRTLSYAELDERSDRVRAFLRARGIGNGATVAVRLERTPLWPIALLGILKAGAAYVPTDPHAPRRRFAAMLDDARATLVLGSRGDTPPADTAVPFATVEDALEEPAAHATEPAAAVHPQSPAYVLYTSGTTGRPKGVVVSHANLAHTIQAVADRYGLGPQDRVLQFAALTFDVAAEELFSALVRAATVVLLPAGPVPGIGELTSLVRGEGLTVLNLPASYWHEWVAVIDRFPPSSCPALRLVVTGSERVDAGRLGRWRAATPGRIRWLNAYGPTEATITATLYDPDRAAPRPGHDQTARTTVPIGRPLPGVRAYVLDAELRPVPVGVPGDLHLAGDGVAQGYLGDPARTAAAFLPDPWGRPGTRMYATGDRVRRGTEGELEFLGRGDDQIKLRGFRIDLGEIEAALAAHPDVRDAAALLREDTPGHPQLVGYIAADGGTAPADLRSHLAQRLPGYMMPSTVVALDRLPRGERGKTDRRALPAPAPAAGAPGAPRPGDRPETQVGRTVAAIWRDVLGVEDIGADDNFFDLGGHSLLMVRVQSRLAEALGRRIPVVDLFRYPTVRTLAKHLADGDRPRPAAGAAGRRRAEERKLQQGTRTPRRRPVAPRTTGDKR